MALAALILFSNCATAPHAKPTPDTKLSANALPGARTQTAAGTRESARTPPATNTQTPTPAQTARPDWINAPPQSETLYYAAGYGKGANKAESTKKATADARETISRWMSTNVRSTQLSYTDGNAESFISISRQKTDSTITGIRQEAIWVDRDNSVWVLLSVPRQSPANPVEGNHAYE